MEALDFLKEAQRMCGTKHCVECPIGRYINHSEDELEEIVSAVEQWSKEHPIITNAQKFEEVFGLFGHPLIDQNAQWWDKPYKEPGT